MEQWERAGERPAVAVWTAAHTTTFLYAICGYRLYAAYYLIALRRLRCGEGLLGFAGWTWT
ncbi:hypothetical protein [Actinomadura decatromicini]|uniref:Uncharacterized protein n=1 Tax=Actinomadura decatromicini TaxID=2604572 RepID=A0A5D3F757_9ACTN|nr:hypothetical protein [Actinomadura decatromicini]TYK43646.1 hypothetical protein FXF68_36445 [Actinomadura decatromicini]